jgi:hypothetical protein
MAVTDDLTASLLRGRNADGGWGYYPGKASRLEPTALATLALHHSGERPVGESLRQWPLIDGLLVEHSGGQPNYAFHGLAMLVMRSCNIEHRGGNRTLLAALQRAKGIALAPSTHSRQDNSLQGWSWIADTFSWVEPTAWCLLALKTWKLSPGMDVNPARVDEAERLLINRSCASGGWNYGNSNMLGQELNPYVPTTAVALLAMQDRLSDATVQRSVTYLESNAVRETSGLALSLAVLALEACNRNTDAARTALTEQLATTLQLQNNATIALSSYALKGQTLNGAFKL